jgi:predicted nucleic acid-binding protein
MPLRRIFLDTNVCYPISLLDLFLRLDEASLHEIIWTEDLLRELAEKWVEQGARSRASAMRICDEIRSVFAGQEVPRQDYEALIESMPGGDPDDRLHAAAAVVRAPVTIVTQNVRDFPAQALSRRGVAILRPDAYLGSLLDRHPEELAQIIREMSADRSRPRVSIAELLGVLARAGVPSFAKGVGQCLT